MTASGVEDYTEHFYKAEDGLQLYARIYGGDIGGLPVICLPGLTRNSRDFHGLAVFLSQHAMPRRRVICLDYRGRGRSERDSDPTRYNLAVEAGDVIAACAAFDVTRAHFIGTSRGGLTLHLLARMNPEIMQSVVLNDIGPTLGKEGLRHIQDYLAMPHSPSGWEDAVNRLQALHGAAFPALAQADWLDMARAIYREDHGRIVQDFDPAVARSITSLDLTADIPGYWVEFEALRQTPLIVIRGENSLLLDADTVAEMAAQRPDLAILVARGQGHAPILHLHGIAQEIVGFLNSWSAD